MIACVVAVSPLHDFQILQMCQVFALMLSIHWLFCGMTIELEVCHEVLYIDSPDLNSKKVEVRMTGILFICFRFKY